MAERTRFDLRDVDLPTAWLNIMPDLAGVAQPLPPLHPGTLEPITPDCWRAVPRGAHPAGGLGRALDRHPGQVLDVYRLWRPTPLHRAARLEAALQTPAHIYFKYEGTSPAGSHKPNTAIAQAYYNKEAGVRRISTETGAGQWGSALSMACRFFDLECLVYMVKASFEQKPYRRIFMETFGATVIPSPSDTTNAGRGILAEHPDSTGSLGIAISEAIEVAATNEDTNYSIGSCLNHVLLHQTVIGLEAQKQMELAGEAPDVVVGCVGGGSNYGGLAYPFMVSSSGDTPDMRFLATEPAAADAHEGRFASTSRHGEDDAAAPDVRSATSCRRRGGAAPRRLAVLSLLVKGYMQAAAYTQNEVFEAARLFAHTQGIVPAPESAHAIRGAVNEAIAAREAGQERVILLGLSGHGNFDMQAYDDYLNDRLPEVEFDERDLSVSLTELPEVPVG
jgi:tryptophan synthase beta chain